MLTAKFLRAHNITAASNGFAWFFRVMYEFWGFCINGGNELGTPHGLISGTGVVMPAGFATTGTLASGSDGFTNAGMPFFNTVGNFMSASYVGKHLVCWQSGSVSTDDSIYLITQWENSGSVRVNVLNGGTPYTGSLHPAFTERSSILYRIVDFSAVTGLTYASTSSLTVTFHDAGNVNPMQPSSQARLRMDTQFSSSHQSVGITLSPSGSWQLISGTYQFTDPTSEIEAVSNSGWFNTGTDTNAYITLMGAGDFLIAHYKAQQSGGASGFHIEIPQRLYPQAVDPAPITMMTWANTVVDTATQAANYGGGFYMHHPPNGTTLVWQTLTRSPLSDAWYSQWLSSGNALQKAVNGRYNGTWFNTYENKFLFMDMTLGLFGFAQNYCLSRVRLRRARVMAPIVPQYQRIGNGGEWLHIGNGVLWPWDNTLLPYNLFLGGN